MVVLKEVQLFTSRSFILEGDRPAVELVAKTMEFMHPDSTRSYTMFDVTSGSWRVSLDIPKYVG